jgi:uncharacterized coiled-coil protein SlyX
MKNYLSFIFAATFIFSACNNKKNEETAYKKYTQQLDSLNFILNTRDSTISDFLSSFNEIEQNLDSVAVKQNLISLDVSKQKGELKGKVNTRINSEIALINDLMEQNQKKIAELNHKLKGYSLKVSQFKKMINSLNEQIAQQNNQLQELNTQLTSSNMQVAQLKTSVDTLTNNNSSQSNVIASQKQTINTAYYVIGKSKDLQEMQVIDKTGGLLGLGKTLKLKPDFNKDIFKRIDYTQVMTIPIHSKKAELLTTHPSDSYSLDKENDEYTNLRITQPEKFWSTSKYLVVIN